MPLAAAHGSHGALSASAPAAKTAGRIWVGLYVGCVILLGTALLFWFTPRTYPNPPLTIALLCSSLLLSSFKLRLPLGKGRVDDVDGVRRRPRRADDARTERGDGHRVHRRVVPVHVARPSIAAALPRGVQRRLGCDHRAGGRLDLASRSTARVADPTLTQPSFRCWRSRPATSWSTRDWWQRRLVSPTASRRSARGTASSSGAVRAISCQARPPA